MKTISDIVNELSASESNHFSSLIEFIEPALEGIDLTQIIGITTDELIALMIQRDRLYNAFNKQEFFTYDQLRLWAVDHHPFIDAFLSVNPDHGLTYEELLRRSHFMFKFQMLFPRIFSFAQSILDATSDYFNSVQPNLH